MKVDDSDDIEDPENEEENPNQTEKIVPVVKQSSSIEDEIISVSSGEDSEMSEPSEIVVVP